VRHQAIGLAQQGQDGRDAVRHLARLGKHLAAQRDLDLAGRLAHGRAEPREVVIFGWLQAHRRGHLTEALRALVPVRAIAYTRRGPASLTERKFAPVFRLGPCRCCADG
jgi:hypothetical protein